MSKEADLRKVCEVNTREATVSRRGTVLAMQLGSGASVFLHCPGSGAGGAYLCPAAASAESEAGFRELVQALRKVTERNPHEFQAKVVATVPPENGTASASCLKAAETVLNDFGIPILHKEPGAHPETSMRYFTDSGRLLLSREANSGDKEDRSVTTSRSTQKESLSPTNHQQVPAASVDAKPAGPRRIAIVDDSATIRTLIRKTLEASQDFVVAAEFDNPSKLPQAPCESGIDAVTLDIEMPVMDGVTYLEQHYPGDLPVVLISSLTPEDGDKVMRGLEAGAFDYIQKPDAKNPQVFKSALVETLSQAIQTPREKLRPRRGARPRQKMSAISASALPVTAIGASTGGTEALRDLFQQLPEAIPPIVVVQHIPPVFSTAFAQRMDGLCPFEIKEAADGDEIKKGRVLIAPGGLHLGLRKTGGRLYAELSEDPPVNRHKPSVDYLFHSVARTLGSDAVGVILTGMGADGAAGLHEMKRKGAPTVAQDEQSCVVYGMPKAAVERGAVDEELSLEAIPERLCAWWSPRKKTS